MMTFSVKAQLSLLLHLEEHHQSLLSVALTSTFDLLKLKSLFPECSNAGLLFCCGTFAVATIECRSNSSHSAGYLWALTCCML